MTCQTNPTIIIIPTPSTVLASYALVGVVLARYSEYKVPVPRAARPRDEVRVPRTTVLLLLLHLFLLLRRSTRVTNNNSQFTGRSQKEKVFSPTLIHLPANANFSSSEGFELLRFCETFLLWTPLQRKGGQRFKIWWPYSCTTTSRGYRSMRNEGQMTQLEGTADDYSESFDFLSIFYLPSR